LGANLRFLIDTNVLISSEPLRHGDVEEETEASLELARISSGEHHLLVHPTVSAEIAKDLDVDRRRLREIVRHRYPTLQSPPQVQRELISVLGSPDFGTHDWYDHQLLACVVGDAVHGLITQDDGIHRKARRLGISNRVYTIADAVATLAQLSAESPTFIPTVEVSPLYAIDLNELFFDSLKWDYSTFEAWFRASARNGRQAFVVRGPRGEIAGMCIFKGADNEIGLAGAVAKISTFKVADEYKGSRYGELLLKALFRSIEGNFDALWLTVFPKYEELIALLETFGFSHFDERGGELRYVKHLSPTDEDREQHTALEFHKRFGPPALRLSANQTFLIPILPEFHSSLFPDAPGEQISLLPTQPHGNALRKAYLSHAKVRKMRSGATLLFYRSSDKHAVTAVGVLEASLVSHIADEILEFVGGRTVYSSAEVEAMAKHAEVLALLFRQDRFIDPPLRIEELIHEGVALRAPQSIIGIREKGFRWLVDQLDA